nr:PD40 domain-containing protein [Pyrinomonadaceae bacterium]
SIADPVITQISSSSGESFVGDISGNGRFVVIESTGNIATVNPRNADLNREIFLFDYAQRQIFQITDTQSALRIPGATPTPTPTPTPSPSPSPSPTPTPGVDPATIDVEVSNNRPVISNDGRYIVFTSNATNPASFDGNTDANRTALRADGNQEIFLYLIPAVANVNLSSGTSVSFVNLAEGSFTRVTDTPASRLPQPGTATLSPFVADDNRFPSLNDDGSIIAFTSTRNLPGGTNTEAIPNPEVFVFNRLTNAFAQLTNTQGTFVFNENPSLSGDGQILAFISNANIPDTGGTTGNNADGNGEIYLANLNGAVATRIRQVTRTTTANASVSVNILSPGRRLSRNGQLLAFESAADLAGNGAIQTTSTSFIYNIAANTFTQAGPRATSGGDVLRFPTFTGDNSTIVFTSSLNFRADGSAPATAAEGLNPNSRVQIFSAPVSAPNTFTRLTDTPAPNIIFAALQPFVSNTVGRLAFSIARTEFGGGNSDNSTEAFYLRVPDRTSETPASANAVSYFTGASLRPVTGPSPTAPAVAGLAPGMLAVARSTSVALAPSNATTTSATETQRPPLPVELNGVTVTINNTAAGLYFVGQNEIRFVVPIGLAATTGTNTYPVVINNNGAVIRSTITIVPAQPDIFTREGTANRALVFNATSGTMMIEPFTVTTTVATPSGNQTVPTVLQIVLTGVRGVQASQVTVRFRETDITGSAIRLVAPTDTPGFDQINVELPASLAGAGDVPVIVTITIGGQAFSSRPADTAPRIQINP